MPVLWSRCPPPSDVSDFLPIPISETLSRISSGFSLGTASSFERLAKLFPLGWSHYVTLLAVTDPETRRFYEIEAAENGWSVRELKRQLNSSLYQRLALSRDKHEVRRLAREGQPEPPLGRDPSQPPTLGRGTYGHGVPAPLICRHGASPSSRRRVSCLRP